MSRVFFAEEPMRHQEGVGLIRRVNLAPAEKFGELVFVFAWSEIKDAGEDYAALLWKGQQRMEYGRDDFVGCVGSMSATALLCMIAAEQNDGVVQLLEWNNTKRDYVVKVLNMNAQPA